MATVILHECICLRRVWCSCRGTGLFFPSAGLSTRPDQSSPGPVWYHRPWSPAHLSPEHGNCRELLPAAWRRRYIQTDRYTNSVHEPSFAVLHRCIKFQLLISCALRFLDSVVPGFHLEKRMTKVIRMVGFSCCSPLLNCRQANIPFHIGVIHSKSFLEC